MLAIQQSQKGRRNGGAACYDDVVNHNIRSATLGSTADTLVAK